MNTTLRLTFWLAVVALACFWAAAIYLKLPSELSSGGLAMLGIIVGVALSAEVQHRGANLDRYHQLRMAALDRRLQVHQEAYTLWRKLLANVHSRENIGTVVLECQEWWDHNCLYLEPPARRAFRIAYLNAVHHKDFVDARVDVEQIERNWKTIQDVGEEIVRCVALPSLAGTNAEKPELSVTPNV